MPSGTSRSSPSTAVIGPKRLTTPRSSIAAMTCDAHDRRLAGGEPALRDCTVVLDERWIRSLHVETLREEELHAEREPHVLFQASTIGALLDGAYEGDLSFAELAEHGDLGLGTLNGLDGEMIALDGASTAPTSTARSSEVDAAARTPVRGRHRASSRRSTSRSRGRSTTPSCWPGSTS